MRVSLQIFLPMLAEAIGRSQLEVNFDGQTVRDLLEHLMQRYGRKARQALLDERGELDMVIQLLLNGKEWITREQLDTPLTDGDTLGLMIFMAGG